MSTEAISAPAPEIVPSAPGLAHTPANDHAKQPASDEIECAKPAFLHSPPDSNNAAKSDASESELSDLDDDAVDPQQSQPPTTEAPPEDDIGEVVPDHWSGTVPVFRPTMHQFKDFKRFMEKVDSYGMKSGILKIIPPQEWKESLPKLDELVKQVRVREPIKQDIMGSGGTYRQVNVLHGRSYNMPQWRKLCEQSEHQPPARRGERRKAAEKPKPAPKPRGPAAPKSATTSKKRGGAKGRGRGRGKAKQEDEETEDRPMTPVSPKAEQEDSVKKEDVTETVERDPGTDIDEDATPTVGRMGRMGGSRPAKSKATTVSARRKNARREGSAAIDEEAFKNFDYEMDISDYTPERCEELERVYWKTLTYAPPLYGADMMGTLFHESTEEWNLNKLPNLLDVLGTKVPGVNTAYLYLGMWKATFAWHLEDVDLYSINYLHFGAPKQWYSISQGDARRFEAAMKSTWPSDAKSCDQFLRHKGYLISPQHLKQHYNITVNKCLSYPGEFVVTYPYGYHSGYNLGYNCAEAVNFALDSWLPMGKIAKRCECAQAQDSVWVDVYEIERKLRGEETEYEYTDEEDEEDDDLEDASGLPSPPDTGSVKFKVASRKRKRDGKDKDGKKIKKVRLRLKTRADPPCCLCPNDIPSAELLPTDDGRKAHRICALYLPETYIDVEDGKETVANVGGISKERLDLKCLYCRSKRGGCFQCSQKKCARAYHATCAAAAGCFIEEAEVPVFGEDGTEYKEQAFEFSCRFHRTKRDRKLDGDALEDDPRCHSAAKALKKGDICQMQYHKGDIFAGFVLENREDEQTLLLDVIPSGERIEVEWKWLLIPDPSDYHLPKASAKAIPLPSSRKAKDEINAKRAETEVPRKGDTFVDGGFQWAEFHSCELDANKDQAKLDLAQDCKVWYYLGKGSTDAKPQYTESPALERHNPRSNYLDTLPKPPKPVKAPKPAAAPRASMPGPAPRPTFVHTYSTPTPAPPAPLVRTHSASKTDKPYVYKPRKPIESAWAANGQTYTSQQSAPRQLTPSSQPGQQFTFAPNHFQAPQGHQTQAQAPAQNGSYPQAGSYSVPNPFTQQRFAPTYTQGVLRPYSPVTTPSPGPTRPPQAWPANPPGQHYQQHYQQQQAQQSQQQYQQPPQPSQPPQHYGQPSNIQPLPQQPQQRVSPYGPNAFGSASPYTRPPSQGRHRATAPVPRSAMPAAQIQSHSPPAPQTIYQKYAFFTVNHNRNRDHYRSPYNPTGGFMNGYEGNFKAHMQNSPFSVVSKYGQNMTAVGSQPNASHGVGSPSAGSQQAGIHQKQAPSQQPYQQIHPKAGHVPHPGRTSSTSAQGNPQMHRPVVQAHPAQQSNHAVPGVQSLQSGPPSRPPANLAGKMSPDQGTVPPAAPPIPQPALQSSAAEDKSSSSVPAPAPIKPAGPKIQYKIPEKQTPVPLPPMYRAAKKKAPAAGPALATLSRTAEAAKAPESTTSVSAQSAQGSPSPPASSNSKTGRVISQTPIPIPMPRAVSSQKVQTPTQSVANAPAPLEATPSASLEATPSASLEATPSASRPLSQAPTPSPKPVTSVQQMTPAGQSAGPILPTPSTRAISPTAEEAPKTTTRPVITETPVPLPPIPGRPAPPSIAQKVTPSPSDRSSTVAKTTNASIEPGIEKGGIGFADVPRDSMGLVEQMMVSLRRASSHSATET